MTPQEVFYAELGREISAYAEKNKTKSLRFSRKIFEKDRKVVQRMMYGIICYLHVIN